MTLTSASTLSEVAVAIACHQAIDLEVIREWSRSEQSLDQYEEFLSELRRVE